MRILPKSSAHLFVRHVGVALNVAPALRHLVALNKTKHSSTFVDPRYNRWVAAWVLQALQNEFPQSSWWFFLSWHKNIPVRHQLPGTSDALSSGYWYYFIES